MRGSIRDAGLLAQVLPGHGAVVNFAAETHVDRSIAGAAYAAAKAGGDLIALAGARTRGVDVSITLAGATTRPAAPD